MSHPRPFHPATRLHHRVRPFWLGAAVACCLAGLTLSPAARAETVALGSFAHADFERNDADTSAAFAAAVQAGLETQGPWKFVERTETNRIFDEFGLGRRGFISADTAARVGKLLKADLLLSGTVFSPKGGRSYLILETDELARAEPVAQARVELGNVLDKGHLTLPSAGDLPAIVAASARLLETSAAQLAHQRGRTVLKFLFLANRTNDPSLNGFERLVATQLEQAAAATGTHRMLRLDRPEIATHESELALLGLVEADKSAWAQVADYYLWGSCKLDHGAIVLELNLWDGRGAPQAWKESRAPAEAPALAAQVARSVIAAAVPGRRKPADETGLDQREKVAALLALQARAVRDAATRSNRDRSMPPAALVEERRLLAAAIFFAPGVKDNWLGMMRVRLSDQGRIGDLPGVLRLHGNLEYGMEVADRFLVAPGGAIDAQILDWVVPREDFGTDKYGSLLSRLSDFQEDLRDVYVGRNLLALRERVLAGYRARIMRLGRLVAQASSAQDDDYRQAAEFIVAAALRHPFTEDERRTLIAALGPRLKVAIFVHRAWYPKGPRLRQVDRLLRDYYLDRGQVAQADALDVLSKAELAAALAAAPSAGSPARDQLRLIEPQEQMIARLRSAAPGRQLTPGEQAFLGGAERSVETVRAGIENMRLRAEAFLRSHSEAGLTDAALKARLLQPPYAFYPPLESYPPAAKARLLPVLRDLVRRRAGEGYPAPVVARLQARVDALGREIAANPQAGTAPLPSDWSNLTPAYLDPGAGASFLADRAANGDLPYLQALFDCGAPVEAAGAAFVAAIRAEQWPTVEFLLQRGYDPAAPWPKIETRAASAGWNEHPGRIALAEAAIRGRQPLVDQLLKHGVRFDAKSNSGRYAVLELTKSRRLRLLKQMLGAGAKPDGALQGELEPLYYAVRAHDLAVVRALLQAGADPALGSGHAVTISGGAAASGEWEKSDRTRLAETALALCAKENWLEGARALVERPGPHVVQRLREDPPHRQATAPAVRAVFLRAELLAVGMSSETDRPGIDLFTAIAARDQNRFAAALARPESLKYRGMRGETALMFACDEHAEDMARQLMNAGASLGDFDRIGSTPLCYAARNGEIALAEAMVRKGAGINLCQGGATRPLDQAIIEGRHSAMALKLLELGADFGPHPRRPAEIPLFAATATDLPDVVRELLRRGADPHQMPADRSIFFRAAMSNDPELIQLFADLKCDLNRRDPGGWSPLISAVRWGAAASVQKLLELGLRDPNAGAAAVSMVRDPEPPLRPEPEKLRQLHYRPDYRRCLEIMDEFGQVAGSPVAQDSIFWHAPHSTAEIEAYLRGGGNVNFRGANTPLESALLRQDFPTVAFLLAHGADPNLVGTARDACHPLFRALRHSEVLELLLKHGANPDAVVDDENGWTVLGHACFDGSVPIETIRLLVRYGANPNIDARALLAQAARSNDPQRTKNVRAALDGQ